MNAIRRFVTNLRGPDWGAYYRHKFDQICLEEEKKYKQCLVNHAEEERAKFKRAHIHRERIDLRGTEINAGDMTLEEYDRLISGKMSWPESETLVEAIHQRGKNS